MSAHDEIHPRQKVTQISQWNVLNDAVNRSGDFVHVYVFFADNKLGKRLTPDSILNYDPNYGVLTVSSSFGRRMHVAVGNVRVAACNDELAVYIAEANDQLDNVHDEIIANDLLLNDFDTINLVDELQLRNFDHDGEPISIDAAFN